MKNYVEHLDMRDFSSHALPLLLKNFSLFDNPLYHELSYKNHPSKAFISEGNIMNPITALRKELRITQKELASKAGITEQVVLKAEQGLYPTLPPSLLRMVAYLTELSPQLIEANYEAWINDELKSTRLPSVGNHMVTDHIAFREWRRQVCSLNEVDDSVNAFCKLLKIHPYVIQKYEGGKMKGVPVQLIERIAFIKGGLS